MAFVTSTVIAIVAAAAAVAGAGISAYGMVQQGKAQKAQMEYNAKSAENDAATAGYAALQEQQAAAREAEGQREQRLRVLGSQKAAASASGLTISGSVTDVMTDTSIQAEKEIQMALYRGEIGAYNQRNRSTALRSDASMSRSAGRSALTSSYWGATGALVSGFSSAAGSYAKFKS